jgi:hypothetical protein
MIPKPIRHSDHRELEVARMRPCAVCGRRPPNDPHHLKSRGAGGGDEPENLLSLCREHHTEMHKIGALTFLKKYPHVGMRLKTYRD